MIKSKTKKAVKGNETKWREEFYIKIYEYALDGMKERPIYKALGVCEDTWHRWKRTRPGVVYALERARMRRKGTHGGDKPGGGLREFIYQRLPHRLKILWQEVEMVDEAKHGTIRLEAMLARHGIRARQHLFLYALTTSLFDVSGSMGKLGITGRMLKQWKEDPDFIDLLDEVTEHKKNFFENALMGAVDRGEVSAILFANKTQNRDRGYNDKLTVEHTGTVSHRHTIDIDKLELPLEVRRAVLAAIRAHAAEVAAIAEGRRVERPMVVEGLLAGPVVAEDEGEE